MDRFEEQALKSHISFFPIYIPVWIDLKTEPQIIEEESEPDLHSSMDRFEASFRGFNRSSL